MPAQGQQTKSQRVFWSGCFLLLGIAFAFVLLCGATTIKCTNIAQVDAAVLDYTVNYTVSCIANVRAEYNGATVTGRHDVSCPMAVLEQAGKPFPPAPASPTVSVDICFRKFTGYLRPPRLKGDMRTGSYGFLLGMSLAMAVCLWIALGLILAPYAWKWLSKLPACADRYCIQIRKTHPSTDQGSSA